MNLKTKNQQQRISMPLPIKWTHKQQHITGASQIPANYVIISHLCSLRVYLSMNHVLRYTQLKFKLDPLMKPEILGSIPSGVANLWTLTRFTGPTRLAFKRKERNEKVGVFQFWKTRPWWGTVLFGVATYFLFLFLTWGKLSKNKNP